MSYVLHKKKHPWFNCLNKHSISKHKLQIHVRIHFKILPWYRLAFLSKIYYIYTHTHSQNSHKKKTL